MSGFTSLPIAAQTVLLLIASNAFMTMAWYGHLKNLSSAPWYFFQAEDGIRDKAT